jgi:glycosyltransferase involved in cell wall biosynthesis
VISWIPDFQHALLPHLFPVASRWKRDFGFRIQCASQRVIVLSSHDALHDCERLYPSSCGKTAVVRFTVDLDPERHIGRRAEVAQLYGLPQTYFFLPNQFWTHKNHLLVVEALGILAKRLDPAALPKVVMTGRTQDPRDPGLFDRVMAQTAQAGLSDSFRHLGQVPVEDVYSLMAGATALINPSRFEGWSTPVEEAKALGTPMLLSNIGVHREQAPSARFFSLTDPGELADLLVGAMVVNGARNLDIATLRNSTNARQHRHATELLGVITKARGMGTWASKAGWRRE